MSVHDFAQSTSDKCTKYDSYASFLFLYFLNTYNNTKTYWSQSFYLIVNLYWVVYTGYNRVSFIFSLGFPVSTYKGFFFFPMPPSVFCCFFFFPTKNMFGPLVNARYIISTSM